MSDSLAPPVSEEQAAAGAEMDALIDGTAPQSAPEEPVEATEEPERDYEAEAIEMGWKPADDWSGDPSKHRDAKTFVELADNDPAVLRKKYDAKVKEVEAFKVRVTAVTKAEIDRTRRDADERHRYEIDALEKERDDLIDEYRGDANSIKRINRNFELARADVANPDDEVAGATVRASWSEQRRAYGTDPVFTSAAQSAMEQVIAQETSADWRGTPTEQHQARFTKIDKLLADSGRFSDIYGTAQARTDTTVPKGAPPANSRSIEGARSSPGRTKANFDSLPSDAKAMFKMLADEGIAPSKEDFLKDYQNA